MRRQPHHTTPNSCMKLKLDYLVHHVQFFRHNNQLHLLIGGGGGEGIPNRLTLTTVKHDKLQVLQEVDMQDDIVWHFEKAQSLIALGTTNTVLLLKIEENHNKSLHLAKCTIDRTHSDSVVTNEKTIERKIVTWANFQQQDHLLVANDDFNIQSFKVENNNSLYTLKQNRLFKGLKHPIFALDLNREHSKLLAVSEGNQICVWDSNTAHQLYFVDIPVQSPSRCRYCSWASHHELIVLHSGVRQPTTASILQALDDDDSTYAFSTKRLAIDNQHSMAFKLKHKKISEGTSSQDEEEFLALGGKADVIVYNTKTLKRVLKRKNVHSDPITTMDIHMDIGEKGTTENLWVASAGMDRCVSVFRTHPKGESPQLYFYFFAIFFLILAVLAAKYHFYG
mmetsp:Transcript_1891/g.6742  ORF Transcript_1891/g.6742 Transcript_1891/m.6742 type:complete len:394 (+) Transcript_1891:8155-9336(+)